MRHFIEFAYNGKDFNGWQIQPNAPSVQQAVNESLSMILRRRIEVTGAGRTDSGVHASQMYAHFDSDVQFDCDSLTFRLNSLLPESIAIKRIFRVADQLHARFDAKARTYQYHIIFTKDPFRTGTAWRISRALNVTPMQDAAQLLIPHTDFECFSKVNTDVNTFNCRIFEARWDRVADGLVFTISADRFLRNMVRAIVGTLVEIGLGKTSVDDFRKILEGKDRRLAGSSAPAHGLFLTKIEYDF